jgi:hypothetical protein
MEPSGPNMVSDDGGVAQSSSSASHAGLRLVTCHQSAGQPVLLLRRISVPRVLRRVGLGLGRCTGPPVSTVEHVLGVKVSLVLVWVDVAELLTLPVHVTHDDPTAIRMFLDSHCYLVDSVVVHAQHGPSSTTARRGDGCATEKADPRRTGSSLVAHRCNTCAQSTAFWPYSSSATATTSAHFT